MSFRPKRNTIAGRGGVDPTADLPASPSSLLLGLAGAATVKEQLAPVSAPINPSLVTAIPFTPLNRSYMLTPMIGSTMLLAGSGGPRSAQTKVASMFAAPALSGSPTTLLSTTSSITSSTYSHAGLMHAPIHASLNGGELQLQHMPLKSSTTLPAPVNTTSPILNGVSGSSVNGVNPSPLATPPTTHSTPVAPAPAPQPTSTKPRRTKAAPSPHSPEQPPPVSTREPRASKSERESARASSDRYSDRSERAAAGSDTPVDRQKKRLLRKAELARASRRRKKAYVGDLEDKCASLVTQNTFLVGLLNKLPTLSSILAEAGGANKLPSGLTLDRSASGVVSLRCLVELRREDPDSLGMDGLDGDDGEDRAGDQQGDQQQNGHGSSEEDERERERERERPPPRNRSSQVTKQLPSESPQHSPLSTASSALPSPQQHLPSLQHSPSSSMPSAPPTLVRPLSHADLTVLAAQAVTEEEQQQQQQQQAFQQSAQVLPMHASATTIAITAPSLRPAPVLVPVRSTSEQAAASLMSPLAGQVLPSPGPATIRDETNGVANGLFSLQRLHSEASSMIVEPDVPILRAPSDSSAISNKEPDTIIKANFRGEWRRFTLPANQCTFAALVSTLHSILGLFTVPSDFTQTPLRVKYLDADADEVSIRSTSELLDATRWAQRAAGLGVKSERMESDGLQRIISTRATAPEAVLKLFITHTNDTARTNGNLKRKSTDPGTHPSLSSIHNEDQIMQEGDEHEDDEHKSGSPLAGSAVKEEPSDESAPKRVKREQNGFAQAHTTR
jgi:hypothetical protein